MRLPDDVRIAGKKTVADWKDMKVRLEKCDDRAVWDEAFRDFFKARLNSRYFEPIRALEKMNKKDGEGFAIVALHCSLIEFFASTLAGKNYRYSRNGVPKLKPYEYSDSRDMFQGFLTSAVPFRAMFADRNEARHFYKDVRCGLLHEARTRGLWRIKDDPRASQAIDSKNKVVYRNKMQGTFDKFIEDYRTGLSNCKDLQAAFIRKFDALCSP